MTLQDNETRIKEIAKKVMEIRKPVSGFYSLLRSEVREIKKIDIFIDVDYMPTPFEIAKFYGISYLFKKIDGNMPSYISDDPPCIYISDVYNEQSYAAKILCAHELGHYFLHDGQASAMNNDSLNLYIPEESIKEYEANIFSIFLMPQIMRNESWESFPINKLNRLVYEKTIRT